MAHEIEAVQGFEMGEAMYNGSAAWHGLGITLKGRKMTRDVFEEYNLLQWSVRKEPLFWRNSKGEYVQAKDNVVNVRSDFETELGVVGKDYGIVQNVEAFDFLDSLIQDGVIEYESAMALRGGRVVVLLARMPGVVDEVIPGDISHRYVMFQTSHDGSMRLNCIPTSVRVVCANTLRMALSANDTCLEGLRHSSDVNKRLPLLHKAISQFNSRFDEYTDKARLLAKASVSGTDAWKYIEAVFPKPAEGAERAATIRTNKVNAVRRNFKNPRNTLPGMAGSWWALYNSVSELVDHGEEMTFKGASESPRAKAENKFFNVTQGPGAALKAKAFTLALTGAGVA